METKNNHILLVSLALLTLSSSWSSSLARLERLAQQQTQPQPEPGESFMADPKIDPKLKEICKQTPEPELCLQSYFVYTGEDHPDASITNKAILRKEIEVTKKMSMEFYTQAISVSSQFYGKNHRIYTLFGKCGKMFVLAANDLISAKEALIKENDVGKVKSGIESAVNSYKTCDESFGPAVEVPKLEAEKLYKMTNICMALANTIH